MKTLVDLFNTILTADKEESRLASREVSKLLYGSHSNDIYFDLKLIVGRAPEVYSKIKEEFREENFVVAISVIYYLHGMDKEPDFLFPWLFELLQHKNGNIRQASRRMITNELGPLTYHVRYPGRKSTVRNITPETADDILYQLFLTLNILTESLWLPKYNKYRYIRSLPTGPLKTVQFILEDFEDYCGKGYIDRLRNNQSWADWMGV